MTKYEKAIMEAQKCVALDPNGAHGYLYLSIVYRYAGRFEEAVEAIEKAMRLNPFPPNTYYREVVHPYIFVGRYEEARIQAAEVLRLNPKYSLVPTGKLIPFKNQADREFVINALRKARLPE